MNKIKKVKSLHGDVGKPLKKKKTLIRRKVKTRDIQITTRKEQPMPLQLKKMKVEVLARQDIPLHRVSSSWIKELGYHAKEKIGVMTTLTGYGYLIYGMNMRVFTEWYYAHSKGTYFNYYVKGKFTIKRYR